MRYAILTIVFAVFAVGCAESFDAPQPDPIHNITEAAAGRAAPTPSTRDEENYKWPEPGPSPEVGGVVSALTACSAAKQKIKARYGCSYGWVETSSEFRNESGSCSGGEQYLIFKTSSQPTDGQVRFEVDRKQCVPDAGCGWVFRHYAKCDCYNTPCTTGW